MKTDETPKRIKPSRKRGVADYPPEFLDIWTLASQGTLELTFDTEGQATNFKQRLHAFRKAWVNENSQAAISHWWNYDLQVEPCSTKWKLVCRELDWKKQVRAQMHKVSNPQAPIQAPSPLVPKMDLSTSETREQAAVDNVLNKLGFK
jgi:hypothetical protein